MTLLQSVFRRAFGHPEGALGMLGGVIMARMNRRMAERAVALLDVEPSDRVLEIGFGPGVGIELLSRAASSVAGIDPSAEMLAQAARRNAHAIDRHKVDLTRGWAEALPFGSASFDKALAINSMQMWPDAAAGLVELRRVMKSGGRIALAFTRHSGQSEHDLPAALISAGFAGVRMIDMASGDFCTIASKP